MPRFKKKEPPLPEFRLLTEEELDTYPWPWDALYVLSVHEIETQRIANDPEAQRLLAEQLAAQRLAEQQWAEEKRDQEQLRKRRERSAARAARTKRRSAKQVAKRAR
jgi:hypothetical protein